MKHGNDNTVRCKKRCHTQPYVWFQRVFRMDPAGHFLAGKTKKMFWVAIGPGEEDPA